MKKSAIGQRLLCRKFFVKLQTGLGIFWYSMKSKICWMQNSVFYRFCIFIGQYFIKMRFHGPLSTIGYPYLLFTIHYSLSIVLCPQSSSIRPLWTIRNPLSAIHYSLSSTCYPLFAIHYSLSTIRYNYESSSVRYPLSAFNCPLPPICNKLFAINSLLSNISCPLFPIQSMLSTIR